VPVTHNFAWGFKGLRQNKALHIAKDYTTKHFHTFFSLKWCNIGGRGKQIFPPIF
jgi:hypothetical protein